MTWHLQTPANDSPKLLACLGELAVGSGVGGGAFAFATAQGVHLLFAQQAISELAGAGQLTLVVGMDAITDQAAIAALHAYTAKFAGLTARAFLHPTHGCFHPKTCWFAQGDHGHSVTGSGNLTNGGLEENWEAFEVQALSPAQLAEVRKQWTAWLVAHSEYLLPLDDPAVVERAKANRIQAAKAKSALGKPEGGEEVEAELLAEFAGSEPATVLLAEVPRSGNRWRQVNFDVQSYQTYFGVKVGEKTLVDFYPIQPDGTLGQVEHRESVDVKSHNYRFEVGAAAGLAYPDQGNPILVFDRIGEDKYRYTLLMPDDDGHTAIQAFLDANYLALNGRKRRIAVTRTDLATAWPHSPFQTT